MRAPTRILGALGLVVALAVPAAAQQATSTLAIRGGTVHTLAGSDITNGTVLMRDGRIVAVGADVTIPAGATVIDASGQQVYPGLFDAITLLGLTEIGAVGVTNDYAELGSFNPQLLGATAVHPASELIPVARANGITHAVAAPAGSGSGIAGQGSLIDLDGWTIEDMLVAPSVGMIVAWPRLRARGFGFGGGGRQQSFRQLQEQYDAQRDSLAQWLEAARQYRHATEGGAAVPRDLKLEALGPVVAGELPFLVIANDERQIRDAVAFREQQHVRIVILSGNEAWKVADLLAEKHIPVILGPTQALPGSENERYDERYAQPGKLAAAGVKFAISTFNASDSRTLPYEAAFGIPFGLSAEDALKAITINPAEILGVSDRLGTIEPGKIANVIVADGTPLEIRTQILHVVIAGRDVDLMNKHRALYEKYRARPEE